ncbi:hypothetical protein CYK57_01065 [Actinobacillus pleuropneumoniae]|nr:hypothetical protein CYK57_01065 [Actinobacillus pleuropneumoniae]
MPNAIFIILLYIKKDKRLNFAKNLPKSDRLSVQLFID